MILEALLEQKLADEFSSLDQLSGVQIVKSRSTEKTETADAYSVVAIASGFRQHDNFSLTPITIPVAITIVTRVEGDANSSSHLEVVEAIADKLSYWHKHGDEMQEALTTSKCVANELKMDGGSNSVYDNTQDIWTDTINITIRGAEKFIQPTVVTYQDESTSSLYIEGELTRSQIPNINNVASINIGSTVTSIGQSVFGSCQSLSKVDIPDSVIAIQSEAFVGCSGLTSIAIPDSVVSIGGGAFAGCTALTSIVIPDSVNSIESGVFSGCSSLANVTISNSAVSIGGRVFFGCSSLTNITIPESVANISGRAFENCVSLVNVTFLGKDKTTVQGMANFNFWGFVSGCVIHCTDGDITI